MGAAQSRQKAYADNRRRELEFDVGEHVFLKVSLLKGVMRFEKKGKLSPRYIGPFEILRCYGAVAYKLALLSHPKIRDVTGQRQTYTYASEALTYRTSGMTFPL